jgi:hypothetical protein
MAAHGVIALTEIEWLETTDTQEMVPVIATHSERRLRLLA